MQFFRAYPSYRLKQVFRLCRKAPHLTSPSRRKQDPSINSFIGYCHQNNNRLRARIREPPLLITMLSEMELEVGLSNRSPYGFKKLNDGNYATWAFDVKYQFLKEKLWGLVSGTESPPVRWVPVSTAVETANLTADATAALQVD